MINAAAAQTKRTRLESEQPRIWKFEIIDQDSAPQSGSWADLPRNLRALVEIGRDVLDGIYVAVTRAVIERKENFDDHRAERKASRQRVLRAAQTASSIPREAHRVELEAKPGGRSRATSKSPG